MRSNGASIASTIDQLDQQVTNLDGMWTLATPSYSDQVLPFNVTLTGANEYGAMTCGKILGIEIVVIDQVSPCFRSLCHLRKALPNSVLKTYFRHIKQRRFVFIELAESWEKRQLTVTVREAAVV